MNGVQSEPEPRSPTRTPSALAGAFDGALNGFAPPPRRRGFSACDFCHCSYTVPPLGLCTCRVTSRTNSFSDGTADALKFGPDTPTSVLKYATACARWSACPSAHSVDPINPSSSASHEQMTTRRLGFHPCFSNSPNP